MTRKQVLQSIEKSYKRVVSDRRFTPLNIILILTGLFLIFLVFYFKNGLLLNDCGIGRGFVTKLFSFPLVEINKSLDFRIVPRELKIFI